MHDLKTPLNAIMVAEHLIEEQVDDPKLVTEMIQIVVRGGEELDELLQITIKIEKTAGEQNPQDLVPRSFELWPLVQSVIDEHRLASGVAGIRIHNPIPSSLTIFAYAVARKFVSCSRSHGHRMLYDSQ